MSSKLSELDISNMIKLILMGKSGTGKTIFLCDFPTPTYVFDFDRKISSAINYYVGDPRLSKIEVDREGILSGPDSITFAYNKLYEFEQLAKSGDFPFKTIALDSLTTFFDAFMEKIILDNPGANRVDAKVPSLQDYGRATTHFKNFITRLKYLPANIIITAHIKTDKDELTGEILHGTAITPKLQQWLPVVFNEVYRSYTEQPIGKAVEYFAQTQSNHKFECRTEIKGLPAKIPLKYKELIKQR